MDNCVNVTSGETIQLLLNHLRLSRVTIMDFESKKGEKMKVGHSYIRYIEVSYFLKIK
jgi:hypothetical protein